MRQLEFQFLCIGCGSVQPGFTLARAHCRSCQPAELFMKRLIIASLFTSTCSVSKPRPQLTRPVCAAPRHTTKISKCHARHAAAIGSTKNHIAFKTMLIAAHTIPVRMKRASGRSSTAEPCTRHKSASRVTAWLTNTAGKTTSPSCKPTRANGYQSGYRLTPSCCSYPPTCPSTIAKSPDLTPDTA